MSNERKIIWWRKHDKEWRLSWPGGGSGSITNRQAQDLFRSMRLVNVRDEYMRKVYHLGSK